jgi:uncharacterized protein
MSDATAAITLSAALIAGVAGSGHCLVMCGGLAGALGMRSRTNPSALRDAWIYHCGRLGGYGLAGALFGLIGTTIQSTLNLPLLAAAARICAGVLLILAALRILFGWNLLSWIERAGARYWKALQPIARRAAHGSGVGRSLTLGLLWGWLPCGLVYSMLLFAALSGEPLRGAAIMVAFGLGTTPAMLTSSTFAAEFAHWMRRRGARRLSGALLLLFGSWLAWAAVPPPHHEHAIGGHSTQLHDRAPSADPAHAGHPGTDN